MNYMEILFIVAIGAASLLLYVILGVMFSVGYSIIERKRQKSATGKVGQTWKR